MNFSLFNIYSTSTLKLVDICFALRKSAIVACRLQRFSILEDLWVGNLIVIYIRKSHNTLNTSKCSIKEFCGTVMYCKFYIWVVGI